MGEERIGAMSCASRGGGFEGHFEVLRAQWETVHASHSVQRIRHPEELDKAITLALARRLVCYHLVREERERERENTP